MITNLGSLLIHRRSIFWRFNFNTRHAWPVYNVLYDATTLTYDFPWVKKKKELNKTFMVRQMFLYFGVQ